LLKSIENLSGKLLKNDDKLMAKMVRYKLTEKLNKNDRFWVLKKWGKK
jgi:hypothetical protein